MSVLVANVDFRLGGNSAAYTQSGFAAEEPTHRWTLGREARVTLPIESPADTYVLAVCATPCVFPPSLPGQTVMLAIGDRLLAAADFPGLRTYAFRLPPHMAQAPNPTLTILHPNCVVARPAECTRDGEPLGLAVHSLRLYRLPAEIAWPSSLVPAPQDEASLARAFESIGQGCHFGLIQQAMGADPIGLLRFCDTTTSGLADGIVAGFAGLDAEGAIRLSNSSGPKTGYRWTNPAYHLHFDTFVPVGSMSVERLLETQRQRAGFLRRKFLKTLAANDRFFVLTRGDLLTEPEALAVFCALNAHGPCNLLWTIFGNEPATGEVIRLAPGFYRAELGAVNDDRVATLQAWRAVLRNLLELRTHAPANRGGK